MATTTIRLTSKRQATFPREVCEALGLAAGDELELVPKVENGRRVWYLQLKERPERPWLGTLRKYARNARDHSMESVRESIRKGRESGED